jgi:3-oxosteroid 1-dehydrogenase
MSDRLASQSNDWDDAYDVVIVGSGAAGLTAGIIAARRGLRPLIIEKASVWGGTSALSLGGIWVPANQLMLKAGCKDSTEDAIQFLREVVPPDGLASASDRQVAFAENAPRMADELIEAGMQWDAEPDHPDYRSEEPHAAVGRCLDERIFDGKKLGPRRKTLRHSDLAPFAVQLADLPMMGKGNKRRLAHVVLRHYGRKLLGQQPLGAGASLVAQLMMILQQFEVPVWLDTSLDEIVFDAGTAVGVVVRSKGRPVRVAAPAGVILCAGGFAHDDALRRRMHNMSGALSSACPEDTGDVIKMGEAMGAMIELSDDAWWTTTYMMPDGSPSPSHYERSVPFGICVGSDGKRFVNESWDYYHFAREIVRRGGEPVWLIYESRHRKKYPFLGSPPGITPRWMIKSGFLKTATSITELARKCGIDEANLLATVQRFNAFARTGVDKDFHRGESKYDRHWGDPAQKPNPNLGPIERAPFYAAQVHAGDLGTKGGFVTDVNAQVLSQEGKPMEGLYASGNVTASVMGKSYPGPGVTLGPAMTFAYIAAEHAAKRRSNI